MNDDSPGDTWRLFYAAMLPPGLIDSVRRIESRGRMEMPRGVRWTKPEQAHLTLAFLGDMAVEHLDFLVELPGTFAVSQRPLNLKVSGLGAFPKAEKPRVIWAGLEGPERDLLYLWHEEIWRASAHLRVDQSRAESRFHPHITLGRVPGRQPPNLQIWMARHTDWEFGQWHLNEVMLVRSILTDQGAIYEPVSRSKLGGN